MATYPVAEKVKRGTKRQKDQTKIRVMFALQRQEGIKYRELWVIQITADITQDVKIKMSRISLSSQQEKGNCHPASIIKGNISIKSGWEAPTPVMHIPAAVSPSSSSSVLAASLEYMALRRFFLSRSVILSATVSWRRDQQWIDFSIKTPR